MEKMFNRNMDVKYSEHSKKIFDERNIISGINVLIVNQNRY